VSLEDLIDFTPELKAEGQTIASRLQARADVSTPPTVSQWEGPSRHALLLPVGHPAVANWQGGSFDPDSRILYRVFRLTVDFRGWASCPLGRQTVGHGLHRRAGRTGSEPAGRHRRRCEGGGNGERRRRSRP